MKLSRYLAAVLLLIASCAGKEKIPAGSPEPEPVPQPEPVVPVDPVYLSFGSTMNNMTCTANSGQYIIKTTGTDPYIYVNALKEDLDPALVMLSFEYFCTSGIDDIQVFYGKAISEARSNHFGAIPASSVWKEFSCNIISDRSKHNWGSAGDNLRLDFGSKNGVTITIRDLKIREMNDEDRAAYEEELKKAEGKEAEAGRIGNYLLKNFPCSVTYVSVGTSEVTVKGVTDGASGYYLADIAPYENITEMTAFPLKSAVSGSSFSVSLPRKVTRDGYSYDRLLSRWALVKADGGSWSVCSHARYADEIAAISSPAAGVLKNKKGIGGFEKNENLSDLDDLGIGSVTVNIVMNALVSTVSTSNFKLAHSYGGTSYFMSSGYVNQLDGILKECSSRGIMVSAILLVRHTDSGSQATPILKHPECDGGNYCMPNLTTAQAVNLYAAALDYLAKRYNGGSYGRIHHWIMHNEVDYQKEWANMGDQPEWRFMDAYVKSMRICHNIARQYDPNAATLISLTHCWAKAEGQYAPKSMLDDLCRYSSAEGDFRWGIAYHPYPQDLTKPDFWKDDTKATYSSSSAYCTFKNLEVVSAWVTAPAHYYAGEKRILFLSENGTNSPSYSETDLARQAAGACWAWKKVAALDGIDAMQWHNWRDNRYEGGLRIGLRRFPDDTDAPNAPKPSWYVWQAAGTSTEDSVFAPYLQTIGISSWSEIHHNLE